MPTRFSAGLIASLLAGTALLASGAAWPQNFPSKNLTIIIPYPAGGGNDLFGRLIATRLAAALGRQVIVDNRTGASGNIGTEAVVRAEPDGHTLLYAAATIALNQLAEKTASFDPARDLKPVTMTLSIPLVLTTHPSLPARTAKEFVAFVKARPDALDYSSGGPGSIAHLAMESYLMKAGLKIRHIPYRGAAPSLTALLSGETQVSLLVPPIVKPHLEGGKLRALGVTSRERCRAFPQLPPLAEAGAPGFQALQWHGFFVPAKTPPAVIERLYKEIAVALATPEISARMAAEGADVVGSTPQQFGTFFQEEMVRWTEVAKRAGSS